MARLAPVLHAGDLPLAELHSARLDGELVMLDDAFAPIDEPHDAVARARSLARACPPRLVAEQRTAAWIWGAISDPPARHQLCSSSSARARPPAPLRCVVREVVIDPDEVAVLAGLRVTTPLRTVVDLARFGVVFDDDEGRIVRALAEIGGFGADECRAALERRRNLPAKRLAWHRITGALGAVPAIRILEEPATSAE
jgi:hypothetical protein